MSNVIRDLAVKLGLQAEGFNKGIKDAQREAKEFEKTIKPSLTLAKELGTGMTVAGGAVVAGMLAATKSAVDYGDALNDARQRTGIAVETLARYGFAAEQSGSSVAGLGTGLKFLAKNMEGATGGSKAQLEAFAELGISAAQLTAAHGDVNQIMLLTADRFAAMEDGSAKTALAMKIFGKSGADLIPMLNEGSAGLKKLGDDAEKAGLVMSKETAEACDKLNDELNLMKGSALGASVQIATALMPALQSVAEAAVSGTQTIAGFIKEHQTLTKVIFLAALAITGAGGLLLAITAVGALAGPFAIGLAAIGGAATLVAIGVGAVGAALGIGIGSLINYGLEVTGLGKVLDGFTAGLVGLVHTFDSTTDAQKSQEFTNAAVAKGWKAAKVDAGALKVETAALKVEAAALTTATETLTVKTRTYEDFVAEGIEIHKAEAEALIESTKRKKEAAEAADTLAVSQKEMAEQIRQSNAELVNQRLAAHALALEQAAAIKGPTGYLNPSAADPNYNPHDPFGLNAKNAALVNQFSNPIGNIASQPALPAALNLGGGGTSPIGPSAGGGSWWTGGSGTPQQTSGFNGITVNVNSNITVTRMTSMDDILDELRNGRGLEDMARQIYNAQRGLTSSKA